MSISSSSSYSTANSCVEETTQTNIYERTIKFIKNNWKSIGAILLIVGVIVAPLIVFNVNPVQVTNIGTTGSLIPGPDTITPPSDSTTDVTTDQPAVSTSTTDDSTEPSSSTVVTTDQPAVSTPTTWNVLP